MKMRPAIIAALVLAGVMADTPALANEEILTVATARPEATEKLLVVAPDAPTGIAAILFVGAGGLANVDRFPPGKRGGNTLYRHMDVLVREGITAAVLDRPSDRSSLSNFRTSPDHAEDVARAVAALKQRGAERVWLVGMSMGSISAASAAQRLPKGTVAGAVLVSSVVIDFGTEWETVLRVPLDEITVPVLVVRHLRDSCKASPPSGADRILAELDHAPVKEIVSFTGGTAERSNACETYAAHGYVGIEEQVMTAIADWIKTH